MATVRDILKALDVITGGRVITDSFGYGGANPFVVTKTSGIPRQSCDRTARSRLGRSRYARQKSSGYDDPD